MERTDRMRLVTIGVLVLVFGTGVIVGVAWDTTVQAAPATGEEVAAEEDDEDSGERQYVFERVGDITPEQRARIDSIVTDHRQALRDLYREFKDDYDPRYWSIVQNTRESIKDVFTAAQAARYDSLLSESDRRKEERRQDEDGSGSERD